MCDHPNECGFCGGEYLHSDECPMNPDNKPRKLELECDSYDWDVIQRAMAIRQRWRTMPDNQSSTAGAVIAEICRSWLESIGEDIRPST
jgi:hypothetical protein